MLGKTINMIKFSTI